MKKGLLLFTLLLAFSTAGNAQGLGGLFDKLRGKNDSKAESSSSASDIISGIFGAVTGGKKLAMDDLAGTWNYEGVSCDLKSDQVLAEMGSELVTAKVEAKVDEVLGRVGVTKGDATLTFASDSTFTANFGGRQFAGTYCIGEDNKSILFSFLYGKFALNSEVEYVADGMSITFDADRILAITKSTSAALAQYGESKAANVQSVSSYLTLLKSVNVLLEEYNGMRLGIKVSK